MFDLGSTETHLFFSRNPGIGKGLAVERDVKPRNMNIAKIERRGVAINKEGHLL